SERTFFGSLLVLFGPLVLLPLFAGVVAALTAPRSEGRAEARAVSAPQGIQAIGALAGVVLIIARQPTLGYLVLCLAIWIPLIWTRARDGGPPPAVFTALITTIGL